LCDEPLHTECGQEGDNDKCEGGLVCKGGTCMTASHVYVGDSGVAVTPTIYLDQ